MKKIILIAILALSANSASASWFGGNNGEWVMGPNGPYYDENTWPEWTPMYWMQEMYDEFDDNNNNNNNYYPPRPYNNGYAAQMPRYNGYAMPYQGQMRPMPMPYYGRPMPMQQQPVYRAPMQQAPVQQAPVAQQK